MNPNNQFSGNSNPEQPNNGPSDTFGATPEESSSLQAVENSASAETEPSSIQNAPASQPIETPSPLLDDPVVAPNQAMPTLKKSKKGLIIIASILLVLGIAAASYFIWDALTPNEEVPATTNSSQTDDTSESSLAPIENVDQLDAEISAIESDLQTVDDAEFADETITDNTLEQ